MPTSYVKLDIIQDACLATGDNRPSVEDDGTPEWEIASSAYDRKIKVMLQRHNWGFAKRTVALAAAPVNPSQQWEYAYQRPAGALHILSLNVTDGGRIDQYESINGVFATFIPPSDGVTATIISVVDIDDASEMFAEALTLFVEAGLVRGLHEDAQSARMKEEEAELMLSRTMTRHDQETPPRRLWRSRIAERIRGRRMA